MAVAPSAVKLLQPHLDGKALNERQVTLVMLGAIMEQNTKLEKIIIKLTEIESLNSDKIDILLKR